jgi:hypothetical protein
MFAPHAREVRHLAMVVNRADNLKVVNSLTTEISSIDLRSALYGVGRRWWVVASCIVIALILGYGQESGFSSSQNDEFTAFQKVYEPVIETDELGIVKVEPSSIVPVPSFDNQLEILRSPETLQRIQEQTGLDTVVEITRSEPKFTIVNTIDQLNNNVSFLATGTPSYTFRCIGTSADVCEPMITAFVAETEKLRKESILVGLDSGIALLDGLIEQESANLATASSEERSAHTAQVVDLTVKRNALTTARDQITGKMLLISEDSWGFGGQSSDGAASTYGFAASVGLIIGLLIALQLAAIDRRVRYAWQIQRLGGELRVLGSPFPRSDEAQRVALASALRAGRDHGRTSALIVTTDPSLTPFAQQVLSMNPDMSGSVISAIDQGSLLELAHNTNGVIVLAKAGVTTRRGLAETLGLVTSGGAHLLGVALID